ncbi:MAG: hypothetical protein R2749_12475 [Acidimicrobiales bacterium]
MAEQNGLIVPIGRWVLRESREQIARWRRLDPAVRRSGCASTSRPAS